MLLGLRWGPSGEYQMSPTLRNLRDPRKGKEHLPHPAFAALTRRLPVMSPAHDVTTRLQWQWCGQWSPVGLREGLPVDLDKDELDWLVYKIVMDRPGTLPQDSDAPNDWERNRKARDIVSNNLLVMSAVQSTQGVYKKEVRVGDDVRCHYDDAFPVSYYTVTKLIGVVIRGFASIWIFPNWFDILESRSGVVATHKIRKTLLLKREHIPAHRVSHRAPLAVEDLEDRVCIVHSCQRDPKMGLPADRCTTKLLCRSHEVEKCTDPACRHKPGFYLDVHSTKNAQYELVDRKAGYAESNSLSY